MPAIFSRLLNCGASTKNDQVRERNSLIEVLLNALELFELRSKLRRFVDVPILLRLESNSRAVRPSAFIRTSECRRRCPGSRNELGNRQSRIKDPLLQLSDILLVDKFVIDSGDRVLPDQRFLRYEWAKIPLDRTHVAMCELEPRSRECIGKLIRIFQKAARDLFVSRIKPE